ncbi:MAG: cupin domain-containing protein [Patescibacteria group bacterium]
MNEQEWIEKLTAEGWQNVAVCPNEANKFFEEHTHDQSTVHVILQGQIDLIEGEEVVTLKEGDYFEIPAGTTHRCKAGPEGVSFIVGFK